MTQTPAHRRLLSTKAEAVALVDGLLATLHNLGDILDQESALLRAGKLKDGLALSHRKNDLARSFIQTLQAANANAANLRALAPERLELYRKSQEAFAPRLQENLTVIATAQALSNSIIQEVATAVARSDIPTAYSARGRSLDQTSATTARPISLNRSF